MSYGRLRSVVAGRGFLLLPAAALAVHELRYALGYGSGAGQALEAQGHSYVSSFAPWLVALLALAVGSLLLRVAHAAAGRAERRPRRSFARLWLLTAASLVAIYVVQELLEGVFAVGHPAGVGGVFGQGGWWAIPLALGAGAVVAALLQLGCVLVSAARRLASRRSTPGRSPRLARLHAVAIVRVSPLAGTAAGRAPPAA
jgi:hypothetical protein